MIVMIGLILYDLNLLLVLSSHSNNNDDKLPIPQTLILFMNLMEPTTLSPSTTK